MIVLAIVLAVWFILGYLAARGEAKYNNYLRASDSSFYVYEKGSPLDAVVRKVFGGPVAFLMQVFAFKPNRRRAMRQSVGLDSISNSRIWPMLKHATYKFFGADV